MSNVPRFGLEEKEEVSIFLGSFIIRKESLLEIRGILEMTCNFILLGPPISDFQSRTPLPTYLLQRHAILYKQCYPRVQIADVLLEHEVLL